MFDDSFLSKPPAKPSLGSSEIDKLENEIAGETGLFSSKRGATKVSFALDDDLFEPAKEPSTSRTDNRDLFGQEPDELFATQKPKPASKPAQALPTADLFPTKSGTAADDLFSKSQTKTNAQIKPDIFESPPDDTFSAHVSGKTKAQGTDDLFSSSGGGQFASGIKGSKGLDDLFADETPKPKKAAKAEKVVGGEDSVDAGEPKLEPEKVKSFVRLLSFCLIFSFMIIFKNAVTFHKAVIIL